MTSLNYQKKKKGQLKRTYCWIPVYCLLSWWF